jgi:hypothetical protein
VWPKAKGEHLDRGLEVELREEAFWMGVLKLVGERR